MATPKKQKNGKWSALIYIGTDENGKRVYKRVTTDTKNEFAYAAAMAKEKGMPGEQKPSATLGEAIDEYIDSCATLSPTTVAGYRKIRRTMFQGIMDVRVDDLSADTLQKAINAEMRRETRLGHNVSAKSIKNAYGLVSASLRYATGTTYQVKLPKEDPKFVELPDPAEVMAAIRDTDIELPCMLALWLSLSMSEVRGLKYSSIRNGCLYIDQVVVDVDGRPVEKKRGKVASRNRVLRIPEPLLILIKQWTDLEDYEAGFIEDEYLVPHAEYWIRRRLNKILPGMTFHQLRHLNASVMLQLNVPDKYAMERGGWSTPNTMKRVYQHTFSNERLKVDDAVDAYFAKILGQDAT